MYVYQEHKRIVSIFASPSIGENAYTLANMLDSFRLRFECDWVELERGLGRLAIYILEFHKKSLATHTSGVECGGIQASRTV